tara:strand:- start:1367 stop:2440 length:1074 start_codon:yes stop_codon:yes gene_type:complete
MIKKILKIIGWIILLILLFSLWMLQRMDTFKTITNNTPEVCESFEMAGSAEDIEIDYARGIAYLSIQDREALIKGENAQGFIGKIDLNQKPYELVSALTEQPDHLRPHGLSLHIDKAGKRHMAVINHPKNRGIEPEVIDLYTESSNGSFDFVRSVSDPLFQSPNDVLLVESEKFYVGNDKGGISTVDKIQEQMGRPMSTVVFYDGESASIAVKNLSSVSGINLSLDQQTVYASETNAKRMAILKRNLADGSLKKIKTVKLTGSPDNINVSEDGSLVVANIPKVWALIQHFIALQNNEYKPSPSQVVRIDFDNKGDPLSEELFMSDGYDISTTSVGVIWANKLFMGSIDDKQMHVCEL